MCSTLLLLLFSSPRGNQVDGSPRVTSFCSFSNTKSLGKAPQVGAQLKTVFEHILFVFSKSVVKVDISEERPQFCISFREFLIEYRVNPLTFEKVVPRQSFSLGVRNFRSDFKIFMNFPRFGDDSGSIQGPSLMPRNEFTSILGPP